MHSYLHNVYACELIYIPLSDACACYQEFTVRALRLPLHISEPETKRWLFFLLPYSMIPLPSFHFPFIFLLEILPFLPRLKKLLSSIPAPPPPPQSFYALAEAESFVVMLCKMPRRGWDISLPAWPPCQLSCRRTPSLLATGELGSVMCSIR